MESDSEASNDSANVRPKNDQMIRVKDLLLAALSPDDDGSSEQSLANVFSEEYDEIGRVKLLHDAFTAICNRREEVVDDPMFEYRLVTTVSRLIQQELLKSSTVDNYVQCAQKRDHCWELLNAATVKLPEDWDADVVLKGIEKLATELATEPDTKDVAEDLSGRNVPFFHADFVSQSHGICLHSNSVNSLGDRIRCFELGLTSICLKIAANMAERAVGVGTSSIVYT
ncbi:unnamed protein product [Cylicocyclus nassatus]|uniref:Uncharacterized protein n=1 Tax=Cylicocyclus nassatus TaxID=53992 RepID=A0AA36GM34_CYLNA|nr:unnamed protein product [Cylicocyclus nassatus]